MHNLLIRVLKIVKSGLKDFKISIIGTGAVAQIFHLPAIKYIDAKLEFAVDIDKNSLLKARLWSPRHLSELYEDLDHTNTDLCIICTPPDTHKDICEKLIIKNIPILVEKPFVTSRSDLKYLEQIGLDAQHMCFVGQIRRYFPNILLLKHLVKSNYFGELRRIEIFEGNAYNWTPYSRYILKKMMKEL